MRILTARVCSTQTFEDRRDALAAISAWTLEHCGSSLPATSEKDFCMVEQWDDRAVQVIENTGVRVDGRI